MSDEQAPKPIAEFNVDRSAEGKTSFDAKVFALGNSNWKLVTHEGGRVYTYAHPEQPDAAELKRLYAWLD